MTGHKKWLAVLSGAFALWMIGGCSLKNVENLQETGKILSETVEDISETSETDDGYISGDYDKEDMDAVWSESTSTMIQCDGKSVSITGNGATADGTTVKITEAGDYVFSGSLEEGQIQIDADKEDMVHIILNGLTASSSSGAVIEGIQNEKMILTLAEGTTNTLSDASDYGFEEGDEGEPNACIFSKDDISVNGSGTLIVNGSYQDGIRSKDDLKVVSGTLKVTAVRHGLKGKDSVSVREGSLTIQAGEDGIKADNDTDEGKGFVVLDGGTFAVTAGQDGIQAETILQVNGGSGSISTGGGSVDTLYEARGLKAGKALYLKGGTFVIDSSDDSIHSNGDVEIIGGDYEMASGDDGIHADNQLLVLGGNLRILKSYEGMEGLNVTIQDGDIQVTASDDGINSAGGSDTRMAGRPGQNGFAEGSDASIRISGGEILVKASGDGIDSNGDFYMEGGRVTVEGPEDSGNGALDYDGTAEIIGGTFIGTGMTGMAQGFSDTSSQYSAMVGFSKTLAAGNSVTVTDSSGKEIFTVTPEKSFNCIQFSTPELISGETYKVSCSDGTTEEISMDSVSVSNPSMTDGRTPSGRQMPGGSAPDGQQIPEGSAPDGQQMPSGQEKPGFDRKQDIQYN